MKKIEKWKKIWQLILGGVLLLLAAALLWAARKVPGFAEWYSSTIYPVLVSGIGGLFGLVPVSVVEWLLYGCVALLIYLLIKYRRKPARLLMNYGLIVSILLFLYAACCGVNYYRVPFSTYYIQTLQENMAAKFAAESVETPSGENDSEAGVETSGEESTEEKKTVKRTVSLQGLCAWLTEEVNRAYEELASSEGNFENMQAKGIAAMERLATVYPALSGHYPQPKPVMVSEILSVQQCSGVYSPFTIEANYNNDMVPYNIPHTICHEMSHLRGFMREDEANFIGYLACLQSEDADFRYSGYMLGWIYAGNALAKVNYKEYERLHGLLKREIVAELDANSEFWERYEGEVAEVQEKVNDAYLKVNGQSDGVLSYGRVVDLMLIDYAFNRN